MIIHQRKMLKKRRKKQIIKNPTQFSRDLTFEFRLQRKSGALSCPALLQQVPALHKDISSAGWGSTSTCKVQLTPI